MYDLLLHKTQKNEQQEVHISQKLPGTFLGQANTRGGGKAADDKYTGRANKV